MGFRREVYSVNLAKEFLPLLKAHWTEIAHYDDIPLNPDLKGYEACEQRGALRIYTFRRDKILMGYQIYFVGPNPHYQDSLQANQDILYLAPHERRGFAGYRFIQWCDGQLKAEGIQVTYQHVKAHHDYGLILERMGYSLMDKIYARRLD